MRIAIFTEVYWPMVSGVGVTLLRLTEALQQRGHQVRMYAPEYALPPGAVDRPEVHRSPSKPFFLYPDIQWAFPRVKDLVEDAARFRPDLVHVATEFAMGRARVRVASLVESSGVAAGHFEGDFVAMETNRLVSEP